MIGHSLNIVGSEWIIIIFVALVLILGTNKLPEAAKKLGKAVNEYNKAKNDIQTNMKNVTSHNVDVSGPVENERQKLETIAKSLGVRIEDRTDDELRKIISDKIGQKTDKTEENPKS
ncbi:MAG: twin-arginine translocase TatA/TatE family subunit [Nitrosarchaeum sp.]|nr:twin-arginine translocase TatA/TatE family subunit [Nitrosarchaeum sp.]MCV0398429.1 twin-arginine translocase TatA/TatE family subunit [Nitrosarchaeum sp.]